LKVFISWSGKLSHKVALFLEAWLPTVIQAIDPYGSSEGISKGARWFTDLSRELEDTHFGILCVTASNLFEPWLLFEAGAIAKVVDSSYAVPLLINLSPSDLEGPLAQFQATEASNKDDMLRLMKTINSLLKEKALKDGALKKSFDLCWPEFEATFKEILSTTADEEDRPLVRGMLKEMMGKFESLDGLIREIGDEIVTARVDMLTKGVPGEKPKTIELRYEEVIEALKKQKPLYKWRIMINGKPYKEILREYREKERKKKLS